MVAIRLSFFITVVSFVAVYTAHASAKRTSMDDMEERAARIIEQGYMASVLLEDSRSDRLLKNEFLMLYEGARPEFIVKDRTPEAAKRESMVSHLADTLNFKCIARCMVLDDETLSDTNSHLLQEFIPYAKRSEPSTSRAYEVAKCAEVSGSLTLRNLKKKSTNLRVLIEDLDTDSYLEAWIFQLLFGIKDLPSDNVGVRVVDGKFQIFLFNFETAFSSSHDFISIPTVETSDLVISEPLREIIASWTRETLKSVRALLKKCRNPQACVESKILYNKLSAIRGIVLPVNGMTTSQLEELLFWTVGISSSSQTGPVEVFSLDKLSSKVSRRQRLSLLDAYFIYSPHIQIESDVEEYEQALMLKVALELDITQYLASLERGEAFNLVGFLEYLATQERTNRFTGASFTVDDFLSEMGLTRA